MAINVVALAVICFTEYLERCTYISLPINLPAEAIWSPIGLFLWLSKSKHNFSNITQIPWYLDEMSLAYLGVPLRESTGA